VWDLERVRGKRNGLKRREGWRWIGKAVEEASGRKEKKRKRGIKKRIFYYYLYWPNIRPALNGAQKLQKIENIILRRNIKRFEEIQSGL